MAGLHLRRRRHGRDRADRHPTGEGRRAVGSGTRTRSSNIWHTFTRCKEPCTGQTGHGLPARRRRHRVSEGRHGLRLHRDRATASSSRPPPASSASTTSASEEVIRGRSVLGVHAHEDRALHVLLPDPPRHARRVPGCEVSHTGEGATGAVFSDQVEGPLRRALGGVCPSTYCRYRTVSSYRTDPTEEQIAIMEFANQETERCVASSACRRREFVRTAAAFAAGLWGINQITGTQWGCYKAFAHNTLDERRLRSRVPACAAE